MLDPRLVEEIFGRSTPSAAPPENALRLAEDAGLEGGRPKGLGYGEKVEAASGSMNLYEKANGSPPCVLDSADNVPGGPRMRTMVEALPDGQTGDGGVGDFLSDELQDIFSVTDYSNTRTKALLQSRENVDIHELVKELKVYARIMAAGAPGPAKR